ncbi:amino acid permease, partial [bacterium]|nr:amino acid permease [bacterium]
ICTVVYIILALVMTGMNSYTLLGVSDPLAEIFKIRGIKWMLFIVSFAAVIAMTSVLLVYQMGQPRIWMSMSRDGLLPKKFSAIHPRFKTPGFATVVTGLVVGIPIFFTDERIVLDFTSIGTLFAFCLVCGGILMLPHKNEHETSGRFRIPYVNAKYIVPAVTAARFVLIAVLWPDTVYEHTDNVTLHYPMIIFYIVWAVIAVLSYARNFSLIPVIGLLSCCYLLTGMRWTNWAMFAAWLLIGLTIYFLYGRKNSKLAG